jgi:hypothetical protein
MHSPTRPPPFAAASAPWGRLVVALGLGLGASPAAAQAPEPPPLRVDGLTPAGVRNSVTQSWGALDFKVTNLAGVDRRARVFVSYEGQPDVQYGRDVWVPARSTVSSWMLVGPMPAEPRARPDKAPAGKREPLFSRELRFVLYERQGGEDRLVLPRGEERLRSRAVLARPREPHTAILADEEGPPTSGFGQLPRPESPGDEVFRLVRALWASRKPAGSDQEVGLKAAQERVTAVEVLPLPPAAQAFDGIDLFVLASGRLADDPGGLRALRQWLEQGGTVWVLLDLVEPDVVAPLLGDALDFQVVDRVSLTRFALRAHPTEQAEGEPDEAKEQSHERPVGLARVVLPARERVEHTVNGWPAWFSRRVGRGKVLFTTLGLRGWFEGGRLPTPSGALKRFGDELTPTPEERPPEVEPLLRPLLLAEIGYSVPGRGTVALVFGGALLATVALGAALRRARRRELLGWLGPAAALGATAVFLVLGVSSRQAAPPTVAVAQVVHPVPGKEEAAVHGLLAVYRPESGPMEAGARRGGFFVPDAAGAEGRTRRLVLTDLDSWHWENLELPAGVRFAPFRYAAPTGEPLAAVGRFGPDGLEGKLAAGPFRDLADALLWVPGGRNLAVRVRPDGSFAAGSQDTLPAGQFLAGAVLSDLQQRRQGLYRGLLKPPPRGRPAGENTLLVWAAPLDMGFRLAPEARTVGGALLVLPLRLERPAPGARVTVPGPLVSVRRVEKGFAPRTVPDEGQEAIDLDVRFQLPAEVLPLRLERARLEARIDAPKRRVTVSALAGPGKQKGGPERVELRRADGPLDPIRVEITEGRLLRLDEGGGLHLNVSISGRLGGGGSGQSEEWKIEYVELEVTGRAE